MADDLSARLRRLLEAAVPVPWVASFTERGDIYSGTIRTFRGHAAVFGKRTRIGGVLRIADADLICEAVNALPRLLDALDAAPPPERVLPEGVTVEDVRWILNTAYMAHADSHVIERLDAFDELIPLRPGVAALSPDSGAASEPPCPTCGTWAGGACQAKEGQRCGWDDSPRDDSGGPVIEEPQRVIVDFAEVEPQHSPLRTWPTDPETAP